MTQAASLRVLVVDDEPYARELLVRLLSKLVGIEVVASAENGIAALEAIRRHAPELVFLDVQMPGLTGIEVVRQLDEAQTPAIIFVTAYDRYAIEAFELSAIDYLLKPYSDDRLKSAVHRAMAHIEARESVEVVSRLRGLMSRLDDTSPNLPAEGSPLKQKYLQRFPVESRGQMRVVGVDEVDYITSSGVYAELHIGDRSHFIRERLQNLELKLDPKRFFRVHRSAIVQLNRIDALMRHPGSEYLLRLKSGVQLAVSRSKVDELERVWTGEGR